MRTSPFVTNIYMWHLSAVACSKAALKADQDTHEPSQIFIEWHVYGNGCNGLWVSLFEYSEGFLLSLVSPFLYLNNLPNWETKNMKMNTMRCIWREVTAISCLLLLFNHVLIIANSVFLLFTECQRTNNMHTVRRRLFA